jgi:hypothetical protein
MLTLTKWFPIKQIIITCFIRNPCKSNKCFIRACCTKNCDARIKYLECCDLHEKIAFPRICALSIVISLISILISLFKSI